MRHMVLAALTVATLLIAAPSFGDVKAGVDAWAKGDWDRAVDEWRAPAVAGDADAQFNLAQAYKLGRGVPVDPTLAESWFRRAALQGHQQAETNYGIALYEADRKADAAPWLEKAVARFEPRAQLVLGTMLFNGDGVKRDYPRAYALMMRASAAGLSSAQRTLADMDGFISPPDRERGVTLARQYEAQSHALPPAAPERLASRSGEPSERRSPNRPTALAQPRATRDAVVPPPRPSAPETRPASVPRPAVEPAPPRDMPQGRTSTGGWRVQLGAFRNSGNAEALWRRVAPRLRGATPFYVSGDGVTRLQAGSYPTRAAAAKACIQAGSVGTPCVVVAS